MEVSKYAVGCMSLKFRSEEWASFSGDTSGSSLYDHGTIETERDQQVSKCRQRRSPEVSSGIFQYEEIKEINKN